MSVTFKLAPHKFYSTVTVVEIWVGEKMVGTIYPDEPNGVRLMSKHLEGDEDNLHIIRFEP
jgi:hypothetical protein